MKHLLYLLILFPCILLSQENISGVVYEANEKKETTPILGANVYWMGTSVGTTTNIDGEFTLTYKKDYKKLIISYVGFKTDTITVNTPTYIKHWLQPKSNLDEVSLTAKKQTTLKSYLRSENITTMSSDELLKSACCNLCESFETNPSIDVNFADALTGTRQIKMLGLTSPYILTSIETVPSVRGAAQTYGLSFIPGTWVESIQITKGTGSVVSGFESIAGEINAKLMKPVKDNKFFVNAYASGNGRLELNTHLNTKISDKVYTGLYVHGDTRNSTFDKNNDTFLDVPLTKQINIMNRWQYIDLDKGIVGLFNIRFLNDEKQTGQTNFDPNAHKFTTDFWGSEIDTRRLDIAGKFNYSNPEISYQKFDLQIHFSSHHQASYFGQNIYNINHNSLYSRAVYSSIIGDTRHKFKTGLSFSSDHYNEDVGLYTNVMQYRRDENGIGAFFEYNFDDLEDFNITAGVRIDHNNLLGTFITPRINLRYTPWEKAALKASIGRGKRSAAIFAENQNMFASSRNINIINSGGNIYGLDPEIAWNYGISYMQGFNLFERKADITFDFYRTDFQNQVVVDWENPEAVSFYNLNGDSYANSFQTEFNYNAFEGFDLRLAYKYFDVKTQYTSGKLTKPLTPKHRLFANAAYETKKNEDTKGQWKFDLTFNWLDEQRFASTITNPIQYQLPEYSNSVGTLNVQVTKVFSSKFEIYIGGENITNVKQNNPILGANNPFGNNFDTTFVYGPIFGSTYYGGLRYKLN